MSSPESAQSAMEQQQPYSDDAPSERKSHRVEFFDVDVLDDDIVTMDETTTGHDQLPTVEEIKAKVFLEQSSQESRALDDQRKQRRFLTYSVVGLVGVIFLTGWIWIATKRHHNHAGIVSITQTVRISHPDAFADSTSAQSRALHWMLHQDPLRLPLPKHYDDAFVQRYIVMTLIFSVVPPDRLVEMQNKFSLLSSQHECWWNSQWKRADDDHAMESTILGFVCDGATVEVVDDEPEKIETDINGTIEPKQWTVTDIIWPSQDLQGGLPPELESLTALRRINMDNNEISGRIPVMPYLQHLNLAYNSLTGYLPEDIFSQMTRLETLNLAENALQGSLPKSFAFLTDLKILALSGNELTAGLEQIYPLTSLEEIYLSYNSFEDQLSNGSFHKLSNLTVLDAKSNRLEGPLPDALWNLSKLEVIDFYHNALDGHINDVIIPNHPLKFLDVSSNILGGGLPPSISNLRELTHLDVSYNRFEVILPNYLASMTKMKSLLLTEDDMFGPAPLPNWIRGMTDLQHLSFRLTSRTGTIPTWYGELTKLELLDLDWNHISGTIPSEIGRLTRLEYLMLNRNFMNGKIPVEVSSLPNLHMLMVDNNGFSGELDACQVSMLVADCGDPEKGCPDCDSDTQRIACPCCTTCCYANAQRCNMQDWIVQVEDEFRGTYGRYKHNVGKIEYVPAT
jgi:Leucine-rich repeat (LRR) protein